jgi:hypothetical protein
MKDTFTVTFLTATLVQDDDVSQLSLRVETDLSVRLQLAAGTGAQPPAHCFI